MECPTCHQAVTATATATNAAGDTATATAAAPPQAPHPDEINHTHAPLPLDSSLRKRLEALKATKDHGRADALPVIAEERCRSRTFPEMPL